jgi:D-beta-D-heptose 7-phosphate kinase/D-beta-D-heptose 1-phosphate adenosyltransferase
MLVGQDGRAQFDGGEVCRKIFAKYHPKNLVITLGQEGMIIGKNGEMVERVAGDAREVFDVSGAGDTAIAFLTAALAAGESIIRAAKLANFAAGIVVSKVGTATVTAEEILKAASP